MRLLMAPLLLIIAGCSSVAQKGEKYSPCSEAWFNHVEQQISTGDGYGHGPDIGSLEWRSVIMFKLGIRDKPNVPELNTQLWCQFIDENYI